MRMNSFLFVVSLILSTSLFSNEAYQFTGVHFTASYKECDHDRLTDIPKLKEAMLEAAKASGAQVLGLADYIFEPDGYTMVILLSESHASIHTYPEFNACFVDLFTCGHNCSSQAFNDTLTKYLQPEQVDSELSDRK